MNKRNMPPNNRPPAPVRVLRVIGMVIGGILLAVLLAFLFGYFVMLLWNWLMPELFGLITITYWQAFGIVLLAKLIFGSFGQGGHGGRHPRRHDGPPEWICGEFDDWKANGKRENWKHFENYWKDEGKKAFEEYIDKKMSEKEDV